MPTSSFETARLNVRRWRDSDLADIHVVYSDPNVIRWVGDGTALSLSDARKWMQITQQNYTRIGYGMMAICARDTGETLGFGGLTHPGQQPVAEAKYALRPQHWGHGYATEFLRGLIAFARDDLSLPALTATAAVPNTASCDVLRKCGFRETDRWTESDGFETAQFDLTL